MTQAHRGSRHYSPIFTTTSEIMHMINGVNLGAVNQTIGLAKRSVLDQFGAIWVNMVDVHGTSRAYITPNYKDSERGIQANFLIYTGHAITLNIHIGLING